MFYIIFLNDAPLKIKDEHLWHLDAGRLLHASGRRLLKAG